MKAAKPRKACVVSLFLAFYSHSVHAELCWLPGNADGQQFVDKYEQSLFMGFGQVLEYGDEVTDPVRGRRAKFRVEEPLKGPEAGAVLSVVICDDLTNRIPSGKRVLASISKQMLLFEIYKEEDWALVRQRTREVDLGLYPPPKPEPPKELMEEYRKRAEAWVWAQYRYWNKKISREEYEAAKEQYEQWLESHPEVRDYVIEELY